MPSTEYMRKWRVKNPERVLAAQRLYAKRHPEKLRARWNSWAARNPEKARTNRRRAYDVLNFGGNREAALIRDHYQCVKCPRVVKDFYLTVDHIDRNRTNNALENLQTLCRSCHGKKDGQARAVKSGWHWRKHEAKH